MRIAGFEKHSMVDYPGKLSAVVFTPGCNMDCFYCHNAGLLGHIDQRGPEPDELLEFLASRQGLLDAVVVSGGEPTLQADLPEFLARLGQLDLAVKLDTNGTDPAMLRLIIARRLVDYVAMDVKAPAGKYGQITRARVDQQAVEESILTLLAGQVDYEFRTTFAPPLGPADICRIASRIAGARRYALQQYRPGDVPGAARPHTDAELQATARLIEPFVDQVILRGLSATAGAGQARQDPLANTA